MAMEGSKPLPLWSRCLITIVSLAICASLAGIVGITSAFKKTFENAQDPTSIALITQSFVRLPMPLPAGYQFLFGVDLFGTFKVVSIECKKGKRQQILFISCPTAESMDAQQVLTQMYERGVFDSYGQAQFTDVLEEGGWTIQGQQVPYRVGKLEGQQGTGLIACAVNPLISRAVILYDVQRGSDKFDMNGCRYLLQQIESF